MQTALSQDSVGESGAHHDHLTRMVRGSSARLAHLSNDQLLNQTRFLVGKTNQVLAALLEHLGEVESRGLHREKRCSSLYTYCIYELRFSEDAASRRASASRLTRQFPAALEAIARGEIHLTGLLQIAPILTDANHLEVLARAKFRTKKEIAKLVRRLAPLPEVPDRIEPLGSPLQHRLRSPSWAEFVESLCPPVRELKPGERPSDWSRETVEAEDRAAPARELVAEEALPSLQEPQLYQMQFTTTEEHAELIEKAKALLSHTSTELSLGELHLQAMRLLVEALEKKRFGAKRSATKSAGSTNSPRWRGRHVPSPLRRQVYERDQGQCTFADEHGRRCPETHFIHIHHLTPFAQGGSHQLDNLTLRCAAHNTLAAEQDFGRERVAAKRDGCRHLSRQRAESG
jgi:hypothetical protein